MESRQRTVVENVPTTTYQTRQRVVYEQVAVPATTRTIINITPAPQVVQAPQVIEAPAPIYQPVFTPSFYGGGFFGGGFFGGGGSVINNNVIVNRTTNRFVNRKGGVRKGGIRKGGVRKGGKKFKRIPRYHAPKRFKH